MVKILKEPFLILPDDTSGTADCSQHTLIVVHLLCNISFCCLGLFKREQIFKDNIDRYTVRVT